MYRCTVPERTGSNERSAERTDLIWVSVPRFQSFTLIRTGLIHSSVHRSLPVFVHKSVFGVLRCLSVREFRGSVSSISFQLGNGSPIVHVPVPFTGNGSPIVHIPVSSTGNGSPIVHVPVSFTGNGSPIVHVPVGNLNYTRVYTAEFTLRRID
jgi:hypothetical protein